MYNKCRIQNRYFLVEQKVEIVSSMLDLTCINIENVRTGYHPVAKPHSMSGSEMMTQSLHSRNQFSG